MVSYSIHHLYTPALHNTTNPQNSFFIYTFDKQKNTDPTNSLELKLVIVT